MSTLRTFLVLSKELYYFLHRGSNRLTCPCMISLIRRLQWFESTPYAQVYMIVKLNGTQLVVHIYSEQLVALVEVIKYCLGFSSEVSAHSQASSQHHISR